MGNRLCIQRTKFCDYPKFSETYGFRAYDDYAQEYDNTLNPEDMELPALEFLALVVRDNRSDVIGDMLAHVRENELGISLDDEWYGWEAIKDIIKED